MKKGALFGLVAGGFVFQPRCQSAMHELSFSHNRVSDSLPGQNGAAGLWGSSGVQSLVAYINGFYFFCMTV